MNSVTMTGTLISTDVHYIRRQRANNQEKFIYYIKANHHKAQYFFPICVPPYLSSRWVKTTVTTWHTYLWCLTNITAKVEKLNTKRTRGPNNSLLSATVWVLLWSLFIRAMKRQVCNIIIKPSDAYLITSIWNPGIVLEWIEAPSCKKSTKRRARISRSHDSSNS